MSSKTETRSMNAKNVWIIIIAIITMTTMVFTITPQNVNAAQLDSQIQSTGTNSAGPIKKLKIGQKNYAKKFGRAGGRQGQEIISGGRKVVSKQERICYGCQLYE